MPRMQVIRFFCFYSGTAQATVVGVLIEVPVILLPLSSAADPLA